MIFCFRHNVRGLWSRTSSLSWQPPARQAIWQSMSKQISHFLVSFNQLKFFKKEQDWEFRRGKMCYCSVNSIKSDVCFLPLLFTIPHVYIILRSFHHISGFHNFIIMPHHYNFPHISIYNYVFQIMVNCNYCYLYGSLRVFNIKEEFIYRINLQHFIDTKLHIR